MPEPAQKFEETDRNGQKNLPFLILFEHTSMPTKITIQSKNNLTRNYMWHSYHFMKLWYKPLISLPKNLGEGIQTSKNI